MASCLAEGHPLGTGGQADVVRLGDEAEEGPIDAEAPGLALRVDSQPGFIVAVEKDLAGPAGGVLVSQLEGV